jgi:hypothetical protein
MIKRTRSTVPSERWALDSDKHVTYEFEFKGQLVTAGMQLKFRNDHATYTFKCMVSKLGTDVVWLELISPTGFHSKRIDQVSKVVGIKRSYKKKLVA